VIEYSRAKLCMGVLYKKGVHRASRRDDTYTQTDRETYTDVRGGTYSVTLSRFMHRGPRSDAQRRKPLYSITTGWRKYFAR